MNAGAGAPAGSPAGRLTLGSAAGRWVLLATVLGSAIASIDATVVGLALPAIGREFHAGFTTLQWVVAAYTLTLSGLLLVGGSLGDRYGRRRTFVTGVVWFAAASLLCALAPNASTLVAARALQGVGGALLTPGSLAILQASFTPADRGRAIGAWSGLSGVGTAVGPFVGGWLVQAVSWRLIFFVNLPLAVAVVAVALRHVPETRDDEAHGRVDLLGGALATGGLVGIAFGLTEGGALGWTSPAVVGPVLAGVALLVVLVRHERVAESPVMPLDVFRSRQFSATNAVTFAVYGALGGALFLLPVELQQVAGYSPVGAGVSLLPVTAIMLLLSARSGALAARIGPRLQMSVGPVLVGAGLALTVLVGPGGDYVTEVLPGVLVLGLGLAATVAPLTATALGSVATHRAGVASAVNNDVARAAGLVAVAVLPAAAGITGRAYLHPAVLDAGYRNAMWIAAAVCAAGGLLAALTIRNEVTRPSVPAGDQCMSCGVDAPALVTSTGPGPG